ncbi:CYTH and CHAD domain-containing protein [Beggiatoa leptomitoformis]|uniref:CHAD domain-containing protein n=1 Tax=Beggiatoa leptomitoformis TaxID=288004 RepID=A0A2N9YAR4_9GAMM|nr:CYTH and CHAD domain-containing protein [Beggiatoa leptomitoformis]AUI67540.1 CHAD domain-containing protein [Beggiatoa leptomitoformis]QGX03540.1 CHAD domain-containing protein [Beggiatoa leptomitoformis]
MSIETELKLHFAPDDAEYIKQHPLLLAVQQDEPKRLYNTYFDTVDCALLQRGIGLRVRRINDKRIQTVKTAGTVINGLHQRQEWETEIHGDIPDFKLMPKNLLPSRFLHKKNLKNILPVFTTDFVRQTWLIEFNGSRIEVALDQGEITTLTNRIPLHEIELELKAGSADNLYQLALNFQEKIPLIIENRSKAARGYGLYNPCPPQFYKAHEITLSTEATAEEAFAQLLWHCLAHLQANEAMVLYGTHPEGVHQMRVALRRLRSCLSLYKPLIPASTYTELQGEFKWLGSILGMARDWDVFSLNLQQMEEQIDDPKILADLQAIALDFKTRAYTLVRHSLTLPRYSRLLLSFSHWITKRTWRDTLTGEALLALTQPVSDFASQILGQYDKRISKQGKNLIQLPPEKKHKLRILIKKMVYGTRFFASLYSGKTTREFSKSLATLQDDLGVLNDVNIADELLTQASIAADAPVRHFLKGWYAHQQIAHITLLAEHWHTFQQQRAFWK